jgi:hypothetical protein
MYFGCHFYYLLDMYLKFKDPFLARNHPNSGDKHKPTIAKTIKMVSPIMPKRAISKTTTTGASIDTIKRPKKVDWMNLS